MHYLKDVKRTWKLEDYIAQVDIDQLIFGEETEVVYSSG